MDIINFRLFGMDGFQSRFVSEISIDLSGLQRRNAIRITVKNQGFTVGEVFGSYPCVYSACLLHKNPKVFHKKENHYFMMVDIVLP